MIIESIQEWIDKYHLDEDTESLVVYAVVFTGILLLAVIADFIAKNIILRIIEHYASKTKTEWDNILVKRGVFKRLAHLAPALVIYFFGSLLTISDQAELVIHRIAQTYMLFVVIITIDAFLNSVVDIYRKYDATHKFPIKSIVQIVKILIYSVISIIILSIVIGKSPAFFIGGLGAMTAVLMLIFKDTILGLVAGVQISANKMVQIGDWIEMPGYGADGDVIDISLTTVKIQNFDNTITTVPTAALVSEGVKNWRGMSESDGRRIKRSINIDMTSVKLCTNEMLDKFKKFRYLSNYIDQKQKELAAYNNKLSIDDSELVNGRRMTNIGTFRSYLISYLKDHPEINKNLTLLVRQLDPGPNGIPIEIYVFSRDKVWANYESIQADIFDHILAIIPEFELRVFQSPTGRDLRELSKKITT